MKLCPYCSREMEDAATVCPHCARDWKTGVSPVEPGPSPGNSNLWRFWGWVLIILVLVYFGYCAVMVQKVMH